MVGRATDSEGSPASPLGTPDPGLWRAARLSRAPITASAGSAAYVGYAQEGEWGVPESSGVPTAVICFAHDIGIRSLVEDQHAIVRWTDVPERGGHFAALEEPEMLVADIREFLRPLR